MPDLSSLRAFFGELSSLTDFLVYAAIAVVTLIGFVRCLLPLWGTTNALRRAVNRLQTEAGTASEKPVWQESRFMGKRLRGSWLRFLQNAEQLDRRGLPCNVEDYINDDTVCHGPGNAQLAELIPNLLTSLGILGTFMGMMQGLTGLDMTNAEVLMDSIPDLLKGMRFAFGTSVAGISCSLLFNMLNRISQGSGYRAVDNFTEAFTQLAMQRPLDNDVQMICQNQDRNHMLFNATDGLAIQVGNNIEGAVSRAMAPVTRSMDQFLVGATRAQIEGVARIVRNFVDGMNESLNGQFLQLGRTMTQINQNQEEAAARVNDSLHAAEAVAAEVERLQQVSAGVLAQFGDYVKAAADSRRSDEQYRQSTEGLLEKMAALSQQQQNAAVSLRDYQDRLNSALQHFTAEATDAVGRMKKLSGDSDMKLTDVSARMEEAGAALSRSYEHFVDDVVEGLTRALGLFDQNMTGMIDLLGARIDSLRDAGGSVGASQLGDIQRMLTAISADMSSAAESLRGLQSAKEA